MFISPYVFLMIWQLWHPKFNVGLHPIYSNFPFTPVSINIIKQYGWDKNGHYSLFIMRIIIIILFFFEILFVFFLFLFRFIIMQFEPYGSVCNDDAIMKQNKIKLFFQFCCCCFWINKYQQKNEQHFNNNKTNKNNDDDDDDTNKSWN